MRGRYPSGLEYVDKFDGAAEQKERLKAILATMNGALRWLEACDQLAVSESRLHQLRADAIQAALDGIRPGKAGRPSRKAVAAAARIRELEQRVRELELAVQEAHVREEVALILSQRGEGEVGDVEPGKKGQRPSVKLRKQKPR
jgi:hypothetical protein